jgi:type VI secretion system protein ImpL
MKKALFWVLRILAVIALFVFCIVLVLALDWPLWSSIGVFLGLVSLFVLCKFLFRVYSAWRSRSKVVQQIAVSASAPQVIRASLRDKWRQAIYKLKHSNLRVRGNPIEALPWFMLIGRAGTGKTTALLHSGLVTPLNEINEEDTVERTDNADWWFFDGAVVIDTAGRYIAAEDVPADRAEWGVLLDQMAKYRRIGGISGLVLAVDAERLIQGDEVELTKEGHVIRGRLEQLVRLYDYRFPIFLLVTKLDRVYGFHQFAAHLSDQALAQAMGVSGNLHDYGDEPQGFFDHAFDQILNRLKDLRIGLLRTPDRVSAETLLFPDELSRLKPALLAYVNAAFGKTAYYESLLLRGLFFSSAVQESGAVSLYLGAHASASQPTSGSKSRGIFLSDFLGKVLPAYAGQREPTLLQSKWRVVTRNMGLSALIVGVVGLIIELSGSYIAARDQLLSYERALPERVVVSGDLYKDLQVVDQLSPLIQLIDERSNDWRWNFNAFGGAVDEAETKLENLFLNKLYESVSYNLSTVIIERIEGLIQTNSTAKLGLLTQDLIRRLNLYQAKLDGASLTDLRRMPQISPLVLSELIMGVTPEEGSRMARGFVDIMGISNNRTFLQGRIDILRQELKQVGLYSSDLQWLVSWADEEPELADLSLSTFWSTAIKMNKDVIVPASYTSQGKEAINEFLDEIRRNFSDKVLFDQRRAAFNAWYTVERLHAWEGFALNFYKGQELVQGQSAWNLLISTVGSGQTPQRRGIAYLLKELSDIPDSQSPNWLTLLRRLEVIREQADQTGLLSGVSNTVSVLDTIGSKAVRETLQRKTNVGTALLKGEIAAIDVYAKYRTALAAVATDALTGEGASAKLAADFHNFGVDPAVKTSALHEVYDRFAALKSTMLATTPDYYPAWSLAGGVAHLVTYYIEEQTSCMLQHEWDGKVMWPLQTSTDMQGMMDLIFGPQGTVWSFADGAAKPYLIRGAQNFRPIETYGYSVPWSADFIPFLNSAVGRQVDQIVTRKKVEEVDKTSMEVDKAKMLAVEKTKATQINVGISGEPVNVDPGAREGSFGTVLTLQCTPQRQVLSVLNTDATTQFSWNPTTCRDVDLQIRFDGFTVQKFWFGADGFPQFLKDFRDGHHVFKAGEFPDQANRLRNIGVNNISVYYKITGANEVLTAWDIMNAPIATTASTFGNLKRESRVTVTELRPVELKLPGIIGQCWDINFRPYKPQSLSSFFAGIESGFDQPQQAAPLPPAPAPPETAPRKKHRRSHYRF